MFGDELGRLSGIECVTASATAGTHSRTVDGDDIHAVEQTDGVALPVHGKCANSGGMALRRANHGRNGFGDDIRWQEWMGERAERD